MDYQVTHRDGTTVNLISNANKSVITSATQTRKLCGNDTVTINLQSATYIEFRVGDTIRVFGTTYTMNQLPTVKKESERSYSYTLVFEGLQYALIDRVFILPENTQGDNIMLDLEGMLGVLILSANRGVSVGQKEYTFELAESLSETEYKNLSLTGKNCLQVLQQLCQEWETEFTIVETATNYVIKVGEQGQLFPGTFAYGRGGCVYELNREKGATDIATRLFVYGGTQNLTYYRHNRLCLPNKSKNQSYVEDASAQATYGIKEQVKNFDDVYPNRIGVVSGVGGCEYNEFIDSSMDFDLNARWPKNDEQALLEWLALKGLEDTPANRAIYNNDVAGSATRYLIAGSTAKIHFQTGALAGYECDVHSYSHAGKKITLVPLVDENGYDFPSKTNTAFRIATGDKYVILDINLPESYKTQAENELQSKAAEYFATICRPQPKYSLKIEPLALKRIQGAEGAIVEVFNVGDRVKITDSVQGITEAEIRIDQFVRDVLNPYDYKLTLTDEITYSQQVRTLIEVEQIKRVVEESRLADVNRIRRSWKDAEELYNMVFNTEGEIYGDKIAPLSIDTTMLKVGARSQQFALQNVTFSATADKLTSTSGTLAHYTIDENGVKVWNLAAANITDLNTGAYYIYARCERSGSSASIVATTEQIIFDSVPTYYFFLLGTLGSVDENNARAISLTYGFSTINGRYIKTGRISSNDGLTYFDLDEGVISGRVNFINSEGQSQEIASAMNSVISTATQANTTATQAKTTAEGVSSVANEAKEAANQAKSEIDSLQIGGTNYARGTSAIVKATTTMSQWDMGQWRVSGSSAAINSWAKYVSNPPIKSSHYAVYFMGSTSRSGIAQDYVSGVYRAGDTITMSCYVQASAGTIVELEPLLSQTTASDLLPRKSFRIQNEQHKKWVRLSCTGTIDKNTADDAFTTLTHCYIFVTLPSGGDAYVMGIQIEKGSKATEWKPSVLGYEDLGRNLLIGDEASVQLVNSTYDNYVFSQKNADANGTSLLKFQLLKSDGNLVRQVNSFDRSTSTNGTRYSVYFLITAEDVANGAAKVAIKFNGSTTDTGIIMPLAKVNAGMHVISFTMVNKGTYSSGAMTGLSLGYIKLEECADLDGATAWTAAPEDETNRNDYLRRAMANAATSGSTAIQGGLVLSQMMAVTNASGSKVTALMNGAGRGTAVAFAAGIDAIKSPKFKVTHTGRATMTDATITGATTDGDSLNISGNTIRLRPSSSGRETIISSASGGATIDTLLAKNTSSTTNYPISGAKQTATLNDYAGTLYFTLGTIGKNVSGTIRIPAMIYTVSIESRTGINITSFVARYTFEGVTDKEASNETGNNLTLSTTAETTESGTYELGIEVDIYGKATTQNKPSIVVAIQGGAASYTATLSETAYNNRYFRDGVLLSAASDRYFAANFNSASATEVVRMLCGNYGLKLTSSGIKKVINGGIGSYGGEIMSLAAIYLLTCSSTPTLAHYKNRAGLPALPTAAATYSSSDYSYTLNFGFKFPDNPLLQAETSTGHSLNIYSISNSGTYTTAKVRFMLGGSAKTSGTVYLYVYC